MSSRSIPSTTEAVEHLLHPQMRETDAARTGIVGIRFALEHSLRLELRHDPTHRLLADVQRPASSVMRDQVGVSLTERDSSRLSVHTCDRLFIHQSRRLEQQRRELSLLGRPAEMSFEA